LRAPIAMAPVALTGDGAVALGLALSILRATADPVLRASTDMLARKVAQAGGAPIAPVAVHLPPSDATHLGAKHLPVLTRAIAEARRLRLCYAAPGQAPGDRVIWPLQLEFRGQAWTCGGWCEWRSDFRVFRLDRMTGPHLLD